ncbi:MAG TPA: flagellar biosynthesis protein FlhB [Rhizomicrobium sp.]|jgi:flagellar biosynthetic protein FlhB
MADDRDDSQRTEEPTQRRLDQARDHGDVAKSTEVTSFAALAGGGLAIAAMGPGICHGFVRDFRVFLEQPDTLAVDRAGVLSLFADAGVHLGMLLAPFLAVLISVTLAGHLLQHRPLLAFERLKPDLAKLSLVRGFTRLMGVEGLMNLVKGMMKIAIVGTAVWSTLWPMRGRLDAVLAEDPVAIAGEMSQLAIRVLIATLAVLGVVAGLDYFLQRQRFLGRNRMSRQEVKEEFRQTEGDPVVKGKLKRMRIERAKRRMIANVPKATVVITNPTHFAVALKYESGKMAAPICVAKGVDALALRIREVAREHDVPIVENPPLARALFATVEVDQVVPAEHYKAVAQVIGYVMRLTGKLKR